MSRFAAGLHSNVMVYGVTRSSGRGIPQCIIQPEVTKKEEIAQVRGTLKVAKLVGDPEMTGLVATSLYDKKPFYMLSNACKSVKWIEKKRKVWHKKKNVMVDISFFWLNVVDDYNMNMNNVDIEDHLRGNYRFDHWMCKRKWWWSLWFWCFQMMLTNSYVLYCKFLEVHGGHKPMSQYYYRKAIALEWVHPEKFWPRHTSSDDICTSGITKMTSSDGDSICTSSSVSPR